MADETDSPATPPDSATEAASGTRPQTPVRSRPATRHTGAASPPVLTRNRLTQDLGSSLRIHEDEVTRELEEVLGPFVEDGGPLELTRLLRAVGRLIEDRQERLGRAHHKHAREVVSDKNRQWEKRRWFQELRRVMVELRQSVRSLYGEPAVKEYLGLDQQTGREPLLLLSQARVALRHLQDPDRPRPRPRFPNQGLDWGWWIARLEPPTRALRQAVRDQDHDAAETHITHRAKERELAAYDREVHAAARWIAATFELADRKSFGSDLRPRTRRRQRRAKTKEDQAAAPERSAPGSEDESPKSSDPPSVSTQGPSPGP